MNYDNAAREIPMDNIMVNVGPLLCVQKTSTERWQHQLQIRELKTILKKNGDLQAIPIGMLLNTPLKSLSLDGWTIPLETLNPYNTDLTILYDIKEHGYPGYIRKYLKRRPYLMMKNGKILVGESSTYKGAFYPCVGNARGFEFDSYTEPADDECLMKLFFTNSDRGIYFMPAVGIIETWDSAGPCAIPNE